MSIHLLCQLTNDTGYITEHQDISGKVDKVNGYSLVSDSEISRLATLKNYNDTEVRELINETNTSLEHITTTVSNHINNHPGGQVENEFIIPDLNGVVLTNAETYLDIPTYDGSNQCVHSKVLYFKNRWNGYKFWMAFTPLPYYPSINENLENPSIVVSNDGENWIVPQGLTNPLDNITTQNAEYNSDTHLVYIPTTNTLEIWYRHYLKATKVETIYKKTSTDGINWSSKIKIMNSVNNADNHLLSPVVLFEEDKWKLWFINYTTKSMPYYESSDGLVFNKVRDITFNIDTLWHHDIIHHNGKYMLVANTYDRQSCIYSESVDGINWSNCTTILNVSGKASNKWDSEHLYRPSLTEVDGSYYFYYTGRDDDKTGAKQGLIKINGGYTLKLTADAIIESDDRRFLNKNDDVQILNMKTQIEDMLLRIAELENSSSTFDEITSFTISPTNYTFSSFGDSLTLSKTFIPSTNINKNITWSSSNNSVATVSSAGVVTSVGNGTTTITGTTVNGLTSTCTITVNKVEGVLYELTSSFKGNGANTVLDTGVKLFDSEKDFTIILKYMNDGTTTTHPNSHIIISNWKEATPVNGIQVRRATTNNNCTILHGSSSSTLNSTQVVYNNYTLIAIRKTGQTYEIFNRNGNILKTATSTATTYTSNTLIGCATTDTSNNNVYYSNTTIQNLIVFDKALTNTEIQKKLATLIT